MGMRAQKQQKTMARILGEKGCAAFANTDDAVLDLFFQVVPDTPQATLHSHLEKAWAVDRLLTLKVIFNFGNVREGGKQDTENFLRALWWLWGVKGEHETVLANLDMIGAHTSLKVLREFLTLCVWDEATTDGRGVRGTTLLNPYSSAGRAAHKTVIQQIREVRKEDAKERRANVRALRSERWANFAEWHAQQQQPGEDAESGCGGGTGTGAAFKFDLERDTGAAAASCRVLFPLQQACDPECVGRKVGVRECATTHSSGEASGEMPLRIERELTELKHPAMRYDPRVATQWCSEEVSGKYQEYIRLRDAVHRNAAKQQKRALARGLLAGLVEQDLVGGAAGGGVGDGKDSALRRLKLAVARIFANGLREEFETYMTLREQVGADAGMPSLGGLFAKWCPTPGGHHDRATRLPDDVVVEILREWPAELAAAVFEPSGIRLLQQDGGGVAQDWRATLAGAFSAAEVQKGLDGGEAGAYSDALRGLARSRLRKNLLAKVRGAAEIPEHFVGTRAPHLINYDRMPSQCRAKFWKVFRALDRERFDAFVIEAAKKQLAGDAASTKRGTIKTGALKPHEVLKQARQNVARGDNKAEGAMHTLQLDLQWQGLVGKLRAERFGKGEEDIDECAHVLPMADVSGSMDGTPMEVCVALSLLLAESCPRSHPFFGKLCTFSSNPALVDISDQIPDPAAALEAGENATLVDFTEALGSVGERARFVERIDWGGSTNIAAAFDLLLQVCKDNNVSPAFVSNVHLVIFSDMVFDQASRSPRDTMLEAISNKFRAAGYEGVRPKIVFWNLRDSRSVPTCDADENGVALLSGFSSSLLKKFLAILSEKEDGTATQPEGADAAGGGGAAEGCDEASGDLTPMQMLLKVLSDELYGKLQVV